ncbi:MAG: N-formylglutamate amidohydrolase [Bacteroidia bacterium]
MNPQLIFHIPHSSINIPILDGYVIDKISLNQELIKLTDWYTDDLFYSADDEMIVADFSRIFCDPERFTDDAQEVMAQFGMGVLYEKSDEGELMRIVTPELREKVLSEYYWKHHQRFSKAVQNQLDLFGKALIIDCHSYPSIPLTRDLDKSSNRPDFNIGTDSIHTPQKLIDLSVSFFEKAGFSLGVDWPYKGSIMPMEYYQKNKNVQSIMLEINRGLYLNEPTNEKSERYLEIKKLVGEYLGVIKNCI